MWGGEVNSPIVAKTPVTRFVTDESAWISHVVLASDPAKDAAAAGAASGSAAPGPHEAPDQSQCWLLRFEGDDSTRLTLQIDHPRKAHHIYAATRVYEAVKPQHAASLASSEGGAAAIS